MSFSQPLVLLLLVIPALLMLREVQRERTGAGRVAFPFDRRSHRPRRWMGRVLLAAALVPGLVLASGVVLLAGPMRTSPPSQARVLTNIELVLDVSGSMASPLGGGGMRAGPDGGPTRYSAAMAAIGRFTERRAGDAFGLTVFGTEVIRWVPLTRDTSAVRNAVPFLDPTKLPGHMGGTRIGHALEFVAKVLAQQPPEGDRMIVLLSDGVSSDLGAGEAARIGRLLADEAVVLHAVHVGEGQPPGQLVEVVSPTGGRVFGSESEAGLAEIFADIDRMQPVRLKPKAPELVDYYTPLAAAALVALAVHQLAQFGLRATPW